MQENNPLLLQCNLYRVQSVVLLKGWSMKLPIPSHTHTHTHTHTHPAFRDHYVPWRVPCYSQIDVAHNPIPYSLSSLPILRYTTVCCSSLFISRCSSTSLFTSLCD
jgi:hypothetical protein